MGMWQSVKNALVPSRSREEELRQERESWKEEAQDFKQRYFELQDEHNELKDEYYSLQQKVNDLEQRLDSKNKALQDESLSETSGDDTPDLKPREKQLFKAITNNAERISSKEDVLELLKDKLGLEWKETTLDVYLSRIKTKGVGDLRRHFED